MYIDIYIDIHLDIYIYIRIHRYIYIHIYTHVCIHVYILSDKPGESAGEGFPFVGACNLGKTLDQIRVLGCMFR